MPEEIKPLIVVAMAAHNNVSIAYNIATTKTKVKYELNMSCLFLSWNDNMYIYILYIYYQIL